MRLHNNRLITQSALWDVDEGGMTANQRMRSSKGERDPVGNDERYAVMEDSAQDVPDVPECVNCFQQYPIQPINTLGWHTGLLRGVSCAPRWMRDYLYYDLTRIIKDRYLCGGCFQVLDERDKMPH